MSKFLHFQIKIYVLTLVISSLTFFGATSATAIDCPENWKIPVSTGNAKVINNLNELNLVSENLSETAISSLKSGLLIGTSYLFVSDFNFPIPESYFEKIGNNDPDIVTQASWKVSNDQKNWRGLSMVHPGSLLPNPETYLAVIPPKNVDRKTLVKTIGSARAIPLTDASRSGLLSGSYLASELVINVKGCKPFKVYERITKIPFYSIKTEKLDSLVTKYYVENPEKIQINFLSRSSCQESLESLVEHLKNVSSKSSNWSISNTQRGVLDLAWSLVGTENSTCFEGAARSNYPFFDVSLNPTKGDGCIVRLDPYRSTHSYRTVRTPCEVSLDSNGFEISRFSIEKLPGRNVESSQKITILCVKGKTKKQVTGIKPVCPIGFKKN